MSAVAVAAGQLVSCSRQAVSFPIVAPALRALWLLSKPRIILGKTIHSVMVFQEAQLVTGGDLCRPSMYPLVLQ